MKKLNSRHQGTIARKREIIDAALDCFTELGYQGTAVSDILKRAGASTGSLYHHFGSKEQLAGEVYLEGIRDYQTGFLAALEKVGDAEKGVFAVIEYHLRWVERNSKWAKYLFRMRHLEFMAPLEGEFSRLNGEFYGRVGLWFRERITAGEIRRMAPDLYPPILMGPCQEFAREYLEGCTTTTIAAAVEELAASVWRALRREDEKS